MGLCTVSRNAHCIGVGVGVALQASFWGCSWGANVKDRHAPVGVCGEFRNSAVTGVTHRCVCGYAYVGGRTGKVEMLCEAL